MQIPGPRRRAQLLIGGAWREPSGGATIPVHDPRTEAKVFDVVAASERDVDDAVAAARRAFDEGPWPSMSAKVRNMLRRAAAGAGGWGGFAVYLVAMATTAGMECEHVRF